MPRKRLESVPERFHRSRTPGNTTATLARSILMDLPCPQLVWPNRPRCPCVPVSDCGDVNNVTIKEVITIILNHARQQHKYQVGGHTHIKTLSRGGLYPHQENISMKWGKLYPQLEQEAKGKGQWSAIASLVSRALPLEGDSC